MEVFIRVVETGGFTKAADAMRMPKATVTTLVQNLEAHLGVKLLNRTTRRVSVTPDGAAYYERCVRILAEVAETEGALSGTRSAVRGRLRVDVPATLGRRLLVPALPAFFDNITISGGPAPARAYIEELMPDVLEGRIEPGRVFDRVGPLDDVPDGYRAMNDREAIKVMVEL